MDEGEGWEMVELEGSLAIGDRMQAAMLHRPDIDGTGSGSLLDSVLFTLLSERSSDVW